MFGLIMLTLIMFLDLARKFLLNKFYLWTQTLYKIFNKEYVLIIKNTNIFNKLYIILGMIIFLTVSYYFIKQLCYIILLFLLLSLIIDLLI